MTTFASFGTHGSAGACSASTMAGPSSRWHFFPQVGDRSADSASRVDGRSCRCPHMVQRGCHCLLCRCPPRYSWRHRPVHLAHAAQRPASAARHSTPEDGQQCGRCGACKPAAPHRVCRPGRARQGAKPATRLAPVTYQGSAVTALWPLHCAGDRLGHLPPAYSAQIPSACVVPGHLACC